MLNLLIGFVVGAVVGIFFYRNNQNKVGKIADKVDNVVEDIKEATKK